MDLNADNNGICVALSYMLQMYYLVQSLQLDKVNMCYCPHIEIGKGFEYGYLGSSQQK